MSTWSCELARISVSSILLAKAGDDGFQAHLQRRKVILVQTLSPVPV